LKRLFGIPWLFAVGYLSVGFSLYFSLGIVAERGLGLTPLIFLGAGIMFVLTTFSYTEGGAMYAERGGSNTFARYAFNELVSFIAGWAVLIDYIIIVAIAAITVPHYLTPIASGFEDAGAEIIVSAAVIVGVSIANVIGSTGALRRRLYVVIALADFALQVAVVVVGAMVVFDPGALTEHLDPFTSPTLSDAIYAAVIATVALAGIEAASGLAPDLEWDERGLRRVVNLGLIIVPILYAAIAAIALMAVPVVPGPDGRETALGDEFSEEPILGVVQSFDPAWVADTMQWAVVLVAPAVLIWAASISMLGLSRHVYTLATNRQIPSWLGKLGRRTGTPYIAIWIAAVVAFGLVIPTDVNALAGLYAFGITLAVAIAHLSVIRLRYADPERRRPCRCLRLSARSWRSPPG
jgi:basic amino acid/polyamine antiporter, APA family